jgi:hypothetical protein
MSDMSVVHTLSRISFADQSSPIAVFESEKPGCVDAKFGATVLTQRQIKNGDPKFIGMWDRTANLRKVRELLDVRIRVSA